MGISVITITLNEESNIADCLETVKWADEIIVVDANSSDHTVEISKKYTSKVFSQEWMGYGDAKNFALAHTTQEWILWLDADERVPRELASEMQEVVSFENSCSGYEVARRAYFLGKWIKHCGWYPGYVVRLFKRDGAQFTSSRVHEKLEINGSVGRLKNDLLHYTDENLFHYFAKFNRYTSFAAEDLRWEGKHFSLYDVLIRPLFLFVKMYILRRGFLDGIHGLILSLLSAAYVFTKYMKLWEIQRRNVNNR